MLPLRVPSEEGSQVGLRGKGQPTPEFLGNSERSRQPLSRHLLAPASSRVGWAGPPPVSPLRFFPASVLVPFPGFFSLLISQPGSSSLSCGPAWLPVLGLGRCKRCRGFFRDRGAWRAPREPPPTLLLWGCESYVRIWQCEVMGEVLAVPGGVVCFLAVIFSSLRVAAIGS